MTNKLNYLNNEKRLYNYIKNHQNADGLLVSNLEELANALNISKFTVLRHHKRLKELNLINCSCNVINGSKRLILSIRED